MLFNLLVFLLIVLTTLYMATQGMLSSLLALATALFSSLLAITLTEPLEFLVGMISVEYQRGITFLLLFLLIFGITRIVADILVPKNIRIPLWANRAMGGVVGFFAAMVVIGSIVVGIEMMPLPSRLLGFERFPNSMQAVDQEGRPIPGAVGKQAGIWLSPDRFILAIWKTSTPRFAAAHPDLSIESYGYRRNNQYASKHTVPPEGLAVPAAYMSADPKDLQPLGIPVEQGKKAVVVRTTIAKGEKPARSAEDVDNTYFRITPSQVRMVTSRGNQPVQHYPIGYLEFGNQFVPLNLDSGQLVDDFVRGRVVQEWVFLIAEDEKPAFIEVKQTARASLDGLLKDKPFTHLAAGDYPQKPYLKERSSLAVSIGGIDTITEGKVYVLRQSTTRKEVGGELSSAHNRVRDIMQAIENSTGGWSPQDKAGLPNRSYFISVDRIGVDLVNKNPSDNVEWNRVLQLLIAGQFTSDPMRNVGTLSSYVNTTVLPLFSKVSTGNPIIASAAITADGRADVRNIPKGQAVIFAVVRNDKGFWAWAKQENFEPGGSKTVTFPAAEAIARAEAP